MAKDTERINRMRGELARMYTDILTHAPDAQVRVLN